VIAQLKHRREAILGESVRMHQEIAAYAKLNQSTVDSTRIISDSLANLARLPDAPSMNELVEAVSDQGDRNRVSRRRRNARRPTNSPIELNQTSDGLPQRLQAMPSLLGLDPQRA